jgi:hypothetical protein
MRLPVDYTYHEYIYPNFKSIKLDAFRINQNLILLMNENHDLRKY